jgi:hypothetical protein
MSFIGFDGILCEVSLTTINKELFHLDIEGLREIISPALPFGNFLGNFLSSHKLSSSLDII